MLMCLWFVVSFHGNFVSFLVVARGNTPAWTPNDNIGRNNENIVRVETTEGIKNQNRKLIDSALEIGFVYLRVACEVFTRSGF
jgi:hypothetical protein